MKVEYNEELDILLVEREEYDGYARSRELGGYVLDLDEDDRFLGMEVIDASQRTPLAQDELVGIADAEVSLERTDEYVRVTIEVSVDGERSTITSQYPAMA
jgi:uncharacterized protein YuzE